jgi:EAL and modified HD-GYP domain-containing signal transduction protein
MKTTSATLAPEQVPAPSQQLRYVARQPIFDREKRVFGYELLFRDGVENAFIGGDADMASRATLDRSVLVGLDMLCDGKRAFVNCTRDTLIKGLVTLLPPTSTVVEILETVTPDPDVMAAVERLKEAGYMIALDDFVTGDPREPLAEVADIIKVELKLTTAAQQSAMVKRYGPWKRRMLAEKVETQEEFTAAKEMGFVYFQGYFFRRPEMVSAHEMPTNRANYLRLLQVVSNPDLDMQRLEVLIKGEASICYRLLRYLNSAAFGLRNEIHSVKHALAILGEREMRRWVRLVAAVGAGQDSTSDLLLSSLVRARFAELQAPKVPHGDSDLFLMGLLSLIDAMLEMPMEKVLEMVPLDKETKAVLLGQPSLLRPVHQLMLAHESGEWEAAAQVAHSMNLDKEETAALYLQAQQWARDVAAGG